VVADVAVVYSTMLHGLPANRCVDACRVLHYAYAQLGLRSELRAVDLCVSDTSGRVIMHGTPEPSWEGTVLDGHAVLLLPDVPRFVDPTVEQFPEIARYRIGPVCAQPVLGSGHADPRNPFPPGAHIGLQRRDLILMYTISDEEATAVILHHPVVTDHRREHRQAGVNLSTAALAHLRGLPEPQLDAIRQAPLLQRTAALLSAIGDAPVDADDQGDWYVGEPGVRLDELQLPPGTPPTAPEDPGLPAGQDGA
jgi:hypothetical protein